MEKGELLYWLWWNRVPGIGPNRFYKLLKRFASMKEAWFASETDLQKIIGTKLFKQKQKIAILWDPEKELQLIEEKGYTLYCYTDADYPPNLKHIYDPPPLLYCWGEIKKMDERGVALIGTRKPSLSGKITAQELAGQLVNQEITIVSGMARGIDSEAHRGALEAQGRTIAVLGSGLDVVYPPENEELMQQIAQNGAVLSEFALGTKPLAGNFPARNRIISGLSLGVVVIEAAKDSGSLITAEIALEQGREVFAVPGNISSENTKGPHLLIRQGAKLVENYEDILSELSIKPMKYRHNNSTNEELRKASLSEVEQQILGVMKQEPLHIDQIIRDTKLATAEVGTTLVQMELKSLIKRFPGQMYQRII